MRRALLVLGLLVLGAAGSLPALAQDGGTTTSTGETTAAGTTSDASTTTTGATTATTQTVTAEDPPPPPPPPPVVAEGVTVAGVAVGGLTAAEAKAAVRAVFARPVQLKLRGRAWATRPGRMGASVDVAAAVEAALAAEAGAALSLPVRMNGAKLKKYVRRLVARRSVPAVNSRVYLSGLHPYVTKGRRGYAVRRNDTRALLRAALRSHERGPLAVPSTVVRPRVTRGRFGPVIVIRRDSRRLYLYNGMRYRTTFGVAVGMSAYPTPLGRFSIQSMVRNPWWFPPSSPWAQGASPVPPGPNNPLGTRWMGLGRGIGIHGTPQAWSIGSAASHGCIRMRIAEAEWLFARVRTGTPVFIVGA
jgi:lipoprotein-anchoring transpeptidase ErfK/SrfK